MRPILIATELLAATALASAVIIVAPGDISKAYAVMMIATSVLPGLMLTGEVKLLNAGIPQAGLALRSKTAIAVALNLPIGALTLMFQEFNQPLALSIAIVLIGALGATAQAYSSTWYYAQSDASRIIFSKVLSAGVKAAFAGAAILNFELAWTLVGMALAPVAEFIFNFRSLPWSRTGDSPRRMNWLSDLGIAYGVSRVVSAGVRIGLSSLFGPLIASFLIIEQLIGGANSLFEKYFVRSFRFQRVVRALKVSYLVSMLAFAPWLASKKLDPSERLSLVWLAVVACAALLPLAEMYAALTRRGQRYVSVVSGTISSCCAFLLCVAWLYNAFSQSALFVYVALPGATFLIYWLSASNASHDSQR